MDQRLTNIDTGFVRIDLGAEAADSVLSLPAAANAAFSTQLAGIVPVGINRETGDTLAAHAQFRVGAFPAERRSRLYEADATPLKAYLYFRAADTAASQGQQISVFPSDTLVDLRPVDRTDIANFGSKCEELGYPCLDEDGNPMTELGKFALNDRIDSIPLPNALVQKIFSTRISENHDDFHAFAFTIADSAGPMRRMQTPYVVLMVEAEVNKNMRILRDSIPGIARFTAFEANGAERAGTAFSSQQTMRTAVFRINIRDILDSPGATDSDGRRKELINAVIAVSANRDKSAEGDDESAFASGIIGNYRMVILDTLLTTNDYAADTTAGARANSLRLHFDMARTTAPTTPFNMHDIKFQLRSAIDRNKSHIYVYLRPVADNSTILWDKPAKIETIFTPSRSQ